MDKKIKVGIIGCGGIANGKHMPGLAQLDDVEMVAFCDIIVERAQKAAKEYGAPDAKVYEDYKELLKDESIDVVHVCTPNREHSFITVDALYAGKHVMCEKPMAASYAEAKKMYDAHKATGKLLTIGYQNRQTRENQYVKRLCESGELGEIYYAKTLAVRRRAVPTWGVFLNEYEQGGGPLIDIATHALDLTLWMMNNYEPATVVGKTFRKLADKDTETGNAWGDWNAKDFTVEDSAFGFITMKNGALINLESSWAINLIDAKEACYALCGDKGGVDTFDGVRVNSVKYGRQTIERPSMSAGGAAYFSGFEGDLDGIEMRQWIDSVEGKKAPCVLPEQALCVTRILEAIYNSAKTGEMVVL